MAGVAYSLRCMNFFCMQCSVFENDGSVAGWKAGSLVANYCKSCFQDKMTAEMNLEEQTSGRKSEEAMGQSSKPHSPERYTFKVSLYVSCIQSCCTPLAINSN